MRKLLALVLVLAAVPAFAQDRIFQRPISARGYTAGLGYGNVFPTFQNSGSHPHDGEIFVRLTSGAQPQFRMFSDFDGDWISLGTTITGYTDGLVPAAGTSGDIWQFDAILNAMDGSDTVSGIAVGLTNADHTGASNIVAAFYALDFTPDAQADEAAFAIGTGWDRDIYWPASDGNDVFIGFDDSATLSIVNDSTTLQLIDFNGSPRVQLNSGLSTSVLQGYQMTTTMSPLNGSDTASLFRARVVNDANHTGTGNLIVGFDTTAVGSPDAEAIHTVVRQDAGWDLFALTKANSTTWVPTDNPPSGYVGLWIRQGVAASQNCSIMARLSDGTDVEVTALVSNNVCP